MCDVYKRLDGNFVLNNGGINDCALLRNDYKNYNGALCGTCQQYIYSIIKHDLISKSLE